MQWAGYMNRNWGRVLCNSSDQVQLSDWVGISSVELRFCLDCAITKERRDLWSTRITLFRGILQKKGSSLYTLLTTERRERVRERVAKQCEGMDRAVGRDRGEDLRRPRGMPR